MNIFTYSIRVLLILTMSMYSNITICAGYAEINTSANAETSKWTLENEHLRCSISFSDINGIRLTNIYNKESDIAVTGDDNILFSYSGRYIPVKCGGKSRVFKYNSSDAGWKLIDSHVTDIMLYKSSSSSVGKRLELTVSRDSIQLRLCFEIYDGKSGLRYQNIIKNLSRYNDLQIENSDVIALNIANETHHLHYVTNSRWQSTNGTIEEPSYSNDANDVAKCFICLNDNGEGWYIAPETNWKTQYGPEVAGQQESPNYYYQLRPFATTSAWAKSSPYHVRVSTCPESLQLTLFPEEEFEYIAVNFTVFKGDIVDGKMAVEEHLRRRFRYHDTATSMMINDWEWFRNGYRTEDYFYNTVLPKAKLAGYDILLIDDGWNNSTSDGKWITDNGLSRDPIVSNTPGIPDMNVFSRNIRDIGLRLGLWYSNSGGGHNKGNDLADPYVIEAKKEKIQTMISDYGLTHQAVDLTQYWQNLDVTDYSHPCDNVYRKAVMTRNMMNEIADLYPNYEFKVTSELDLYPNPGDRMTELLHLPNNGWMTITGNDKPIDAMGIYFGHLPLNAVYLGSGGDPSLHTDNLYAAMCARDVKAYTFPTDWDANALTLMGQFNAWRKSTRINALTNSIVRPVYLGKGWNSADASEWNPVSGPYLWMYTNDERSKALLIATNGGRSMTAPSSNYPLRWLDETKYYIVEDVTLDDTGVFTFAYKGRYSGKVLNEDGLYVNLYENTSPAKVYWIVEDNGSERQLVYADESVDSYSAAFQDNILTILAKGKANGTGNVIVYGNATTMTIPLHFDSKGEVEIEVADIVNNDIPYPGKDGKTIRLEFEDYNATLVKSVNDIKVNIFDNGNIDEEHGYSSVMIMKDVGDYVIYKMSLPIPGRYDVSLNYKLSNTNRGTVQFYYVNDDAIETALGGPIDESTYESEKMVTVNLGSINVINAGPVLIKMQLTGGGKSGTGRYIGANYIIFTPQKK